MIITNNEFSDKVFLHIGFQGLNKETFVAKFNKEVDKKILDRFKKFLPFTASGPAHTMSSGQNLFFTIPDTELINYLSLQKKDGFQNRSSAKPGSLFLRYSQIGCFMYDKSEDHGAYMPCVLCIEESDVERLKQACRKFWEMQSISDRKMVLSIEFSLSKVQDIVPFPKLDWVKTGNGNVDKSIEHILNQTSSIWSYPPHDIIEFIKYGNKNRKEGTDGHTFPMNVIFNSVVMLLSNFAHAAPVNFIPKLIEDLQNTNASKNQIDCVINFVCNYIDLQLTYLRSIDTGSFVSVCEIYSAALKNAKNLDEIKALTDAFVLFGARIHTWVTYFFPYYAGADITYNNLESFLPKNLLEVYKTNQGKLSLENIYHFVRDGFLITKEEVSKNFNNSELIKYLKNDQDIQESILLPLLGKNLRFVNAKIMDLADLISWQQIISFFPRSSPNSISLLISTDIDAEFQMISKSNALGTCLQNESNNSIDNNVLKKIYQDIEKNLVNQTIKKLGIFCINNLTVFRSIKNAGSCIILAYEAQESL